MVSILVIMASTVLAYVLIAIYKKTIQYGFNSDAADYAQIAREIIRTKKIRTNILTPLRLGFSKKVAANNYDLCRQPLFSIILALFFKLFGAKEKVQIDVSKLFYLITIPIIYLTVNHFTGVFVAVCVLLLFIFNNDVIDLCLSGYSETLLLFLYSLLVYLLSLNAINPLIIGILAGLCFLVRYNMIALSFLLVLYYLSSHGYSNHNTLDAISFVCGFIVIASPWLIRNYIVTGSLLFSEEKYILVCNTSIYPGEVIYKQFEHKSLFDCILKVRSELVDKWRKGLIEYLGLLGRNNVLNIFFFLCIGPLLIDLKIRNIAVLVYVLYAFHVIVMPLFHSYVRYVMPFFPLVYMMTVMAICSSIVKYLGIHMVKMVLGVFVIYNIVLFMTRWYRRINRFNIIDHLDNIYVSDYLKINNDKSTYVASDIPWAIAWHADRKCIMLPENPSDIEKLYNSKHIISCIYLSAFLNWQPETEGLRKWKEICLTQPTDLFFGKLHYKLSNVFEKGDYIDNRANPMCYKLTME